MNIQISETFKNLMPSLTEEEYNNLEQSIVTEGCRDALVLWNGYLIDGHNRYEICQKHNIPFTTSEKSFDNEHDVINWIIDNQLSRRNITDDQRVYLIGKRYKEEKKAIGENKATDDIKFMKELAQRNLTNDQRAYLVGKRYEVEKRNNSLKQVDHSEPPYLESKSKPTSQKIAEQSKVGQATVKRAEKFADAVDKVAENTGIKKKRKL